MGVQRCHAQTNYPHTLPFHLLAVPELYFESSNQNKLERPDFSDRYNRQCLYSPSRKFCRGRMKSTLPTREMRARSVDDKFPSTTSEYLNAHCAWLRHPLIPGQMWRVGTGKSRQVRTISPARALNDSPPGKDARWNAAPLEERARMSTEAAWN